MAGQRVEQLTPLELEIMQVLWETGPANVQTVQRQLARPLAYTSVQTMLNVLKRKKKVKRTLKDKAYFYRPAVSRSQATSHAIGDLIDRMFGGSAENLVMGLLQTKRLSAAKLSELNKLIEKDHHDDQN